MSVTTKTDSTNAPRYPKKDSAGTPRTRGSIVDKATMDEPMNRPAMIMPSDNLLMMTERLRIGASEPKTSMFTFTCPRVSICSAWPAYFAVSSEPEPAARSASANSCIAPISSAFVSFVRRICALMMDTMFSLGMSGITVPSSVTMPRDTLVMDGGIDA